MGDFQRGDNRGGGFKGGNRDSGRPSFPKKNFGGDRDGRGVQMHSATCSDCGKRCEVPFRPTGDKPVFCNDCFANKRDNDDRGGRPTNNLREPRNNFNDRFNERAPRKDFTQRETPKSYEVPKNNDNSEIKKQLEMLNTKMDRLIQTLTNNVSTPVKKENTPTVEVKKIAKAPVVKKSTKTLAVAKTLTKTTKPAVKKTVTKKKK